MALEPKRSNIKLTDTRVEALKKTDKLQRIWDSIVPGFHVRITPAGTKSYCVTFQRPTGQKVSITIGECGSWDVKAAREKAQELRKLHDEGRDIRVALQAERRALDLQALVELWRRDYKQLLKVRSQASYECVLKTVVLPVLGNRLVRDLTYEDIKYLHRKEGKQHAVNANRAIAVLSRLLSIAEKEGWRPINSNPCRQLEKSTEKARSRVLSAEEYDRLGFAMVNLVGKKKLYEGVADLIRFLAMSGIRKNEALTLKWSDVDLVRNTLRFDEHKTSEKVGAKVLPLNSHLREILHRRAEVRISSYVWPGLKQERPLGGFTKMWARICNSENANLVDVNPHDLRRTFMTTCTELGYPPAIGDALLGHSLGRIRDTYINLGCDGIMATASQDTADWINAALQGQMPQPGKKVLKGNQ